MRFPLKKKRCWYCGRVGWLGWVKRPFPAASDECKNDDDCFARRANSQEDRRVY